MVDDINDDRIAPTGTGGDTLPVGRTEHADPVRRKSGMKQRVVAAIVAVASTALIAVSAYFLISGWTPGQSQDLLQTTQQAPVSSDDVSGERPDVEDASNSEADVEDASPSHGAAEGAQEGGDTSSSDADAVSGGVDTGGSSGSSSTGGGSTGAAGQQQAATVTISVSVSSSVVGNPVSGGANPTFSSGATAYDALCATGLSVNARNTPMGIYIDAVGGLAEKQHGGGSGWKYSVNGVDPNYSSGSYVLQDGDVVAWRYVLAQND